MALKDDLLPSSLNGVTFYSSGFETESGRRIINHDFINSNVREMQDIGAFPKIFSFYDVSINPDNYAFNKAALMSILDNGGFMDLVHPFFGSVRVKLDGTYKVLESFNKIGLANFQFTLKIAEEENFPTALIGDSSTILKNTSTAIEYLKIPFENSFEVRNSVNFLDVKNKIEEFNNFVNDVVMTFVSAEESLSEFQNEYEDFLANQYKLIEAPGNLISNIFEIMELLNASVENVEDAIETMNSFYRFGEEDEEINLNTFSNVQDYNNRQLLNLSIQAAALLFNYQNSTLKKYLTVDDINKQRNSMEVVYNKILNNPMSDSYDFTTVNIARNDMRQFFELELLQAYRITTVDINEIPITTLTYQYYGSLDNVDTLIELNKIYDLSAVKGSIKVLTK